MVLAAARANGFLAGGAEAVDQEVRPTTSQVEGNFYTHILVTVARLRDRDVARSTSTGRFRGDCWRDLPFWLTLGKRQYARQLNLARHQLREMSEKSNRQVAECLGCLTLRSELSGKKWKLVDKLTTRKPWSSKMALPNLSLRFTLIASLICCAKFLGHETCSIIACSPQ